LSSHEEAPRGHNKPGKRSDVGYGRPPREYRFKTGQSGNPRGRPKGSKNRENIISERLDRRVVIPDPVRENRPTPILSARIATLKIEAELACLPAVPVIKLKERYRALFRAEPPKALGPDLLRRSIAHRIQEKAYGGLRADARRLLNQLVKAAAAELEAGQELPRRIKQGSELVRTWNGRTYRVLIIDKGFAYDGKTFSRLSDIASLITGMECDGPTFFDLRWVKG
jgi:hypothetical protein